MRVLILLAALLLTPFASAQCRGGNCGGGLPSMFGPPVFMPPAPVFQPQMTPPPICQPFNVPPAAPPDASGAAVSPPTAAPAPDCCEDCRKRLDALEEKLKACPCCNPARAGQGQPPKQQSFTATAPDDPPPLNFGVVTEKLCRDRDCKPKYSMNGKECSKRECFEALEAEGGNLPDDDKAYRLTAIGTPDETKAISADVETSPLFSDLKGKFTFHAYTPDAPMIASLGFAPGTPSVYLQDPGGKVLARWENYVPESVAGEVRKRDPNYDKDKDPQPLKKPNSPLGPNGVDLSQIPLSWLVIGGLGLLVFFKK